MITRRTALAGLASAALRAAPGGSTELWRLNSLKHVGKHQALVEGHPRIVQGATVFDGVKDAIFLDVHPLAGAAQFTWEAIFRPAADGAPAQRFFHLQENGTDNRMLFETRLVEGKWYLDSFVKSGEASATLVDPKKLHSVGEWHHVAAVCDGRELRNYVDGVQQGGAAIAFQPHKEGRTSLGVRINRVDYFKGEIRTARMTRNALSPVDFLKK